MKTVKTLKNNDGKIYFIVIETDDPGKFLQDLWKEVNHVVHEDACQELTDRMRDFRTRADNNTARIFTHAWHPSGDTRELHQDVLAFLASKGLLPKE